MAAGYDASKDIDIGCKPKSGTTTFKVEDLADGGFCTQDTDANGKIPFACAIYGQIH